MKGGRSQRQPQEERCPGAHEAPAAPWGAGGLAAKPTYCRRAASALHSLNQMLPGVLLETKWNTVFQCILPPVCQALIRNTGLGRNGCESPASPADPASYRSLRCTQFPKRMKSTLRGLIRASSCVCSNDGWTNRSRL